MAEARAPLPTPEDIAWVNSGEVPGNLRFTTSQHYGSQGARQAGGIVGASPMLVNGGASPAFASEGLPAHDKLANVHAVASPSPDYEEQVPLPTSPEDLEIDINGRFLDNYERDFRTESPEDNLDHDPEIANFVTEHRELLSNPSLIDGEIVITGLASDEAGGENLGESDEDNEYLAGQRGFLVAGALIYQVREQFGVDISDKVRLGAREDLLSDAEIAELTTLADVDHFNYEGGVKQMIDAYNGILTGRINDVPPQVAKVLDKALGRSRGATVEIHGHEKPPTSSIPKHVGRAVMAQMTPGFLPGRFAFDRDRGRRADQFAGKIRGSQVDPRAPGHHQKQPRNQNFSKNAQSPRVGQRKGRMGRNHGGSRRGKR